MYVCEYNVLTASCKASSLFLAPVRCEVIADPPRPATYKE